MPATKAKKNKCETLEKGDITIDGVNEPVFCRKYKSHQRGEAHFYNNRKGVKVTVYPEVRRMFVNGEERRFNKDATLQAALVKQMNREIASADNE
jgi:hypothetical protein